MGVDVGVEVGCAVVLDKWLIGRALVDRWLIDRGLVGRVILFERALVAE